jgi:hypothetical protein
LEATGGADASVRLWQIQAVKQGLNVHTTWLDLESVQKVGLSADVLLSVAKKGDKNVRSLNDIAL